MVPKISRLICAALFLICTISVYVDGREIRLALPADSRVKVRWVSPPLDTGQVQKAGWYEAWRWYEDINFAIDADGAPWLAVTDRYNMKGIVLNPIKQYRLRLSHPFRRMVCLGNGALFFGTAHDLGFIGPIDSPAIRDDGFAVVPFQPAIALPLPEGRIYAGGGEALYVVGIADNGDSEVYLLRPERVAHSEQKILRRFRRIFVSQEPVGAVTGDGRETFVSSGRTIIRLSHEDRMQTNFLVHPGDAIRQMAYDAESGLFYATERAVGVVGEHGAWDFLPSDRAQIALRDDSLYVCRPGTLDVFALDHVSDIAGHARDSADETRVRPTEAVSVTNIRFATKPSDPNDEVVYGREFDRAKIGEVEATVSLHPQSKETHSVILTVLFDGPKDLREDGIMMGGRSNTLVLSFKEGKDQGWRFYPTFPWYPGDYSMKVLIDGVSVKTAKFKVTGKTTVNEAAMQDNIPMLKTLLEQGGNANERDADNSTPLFAAAFHGSTVAAELLLKHGADVDAKDDRGRTALFDLALGCDYNPAGAHETALLLLKHGADVTAKDHEGAGVLEHGLHSLGPGLVNLADLLLQHGAKADLRDKEGRTRLYKLVNAYCRDPLLKGEMAECLIRHGADPAAKDNDGDSILTSAIMSNETVFVRVLFEHGINPNNPDIDKNGVKRFPVNRVGFYNCDPSQMLELLLGHGVNPNIEDAPSNYSGFTVLAGAIERACPKSVRVLLRYGASLSADCRVNNQTASPLRGALSSYFKYAPDNRVMAQKAKDIFFMLLAGGARLRTREESIVADKRLHGWLPQDFILDVLERNDQAVLDARDLTDPQLQKVVISRLLEMARARTAAAASKEGYQTALALCDQAKTRAQVWKIESQCPLIYYNTGLLYGQLGEVEAAKENFRRYLALAPEARDAEAIRKSVGL